MQDGSYVRHRGQSRSETENGMEAASGRGRGNGDAVYGHRIQFCKMKKVLEMDGGGNCTAI